MKLPAIALATAGILALGATTSSAHHSTAMFEWGSAVPLEDATVTRWEWTNPHTFLYVTAKDSSGQTKRWAFEGMSPNHLSPRRLVAQHLATGRQDRPDLLPAARWP